MLVEGACHRLKAQPVSRYDEATSGDDSGSSTLKGLMTKGKSKNGTPVDRAAEVVGHALGSVAGTIESLQAQHPHPVEEAREALAAGQETLAAVASKARTRAAAMIEKAKAVAGRTKKAAAKAQAKARRKSKPAVARATRTARKVGKRAKRAVKSGRKTVRRAARRLKR